MDNYIYIQTTVVNNTIYKSSDYWFRLSN